MYSTGTKCVSFVREFFLSPQKSSRLKSEIPEDDLCFQEGEEVNSGRQPVDADWPDN